MVEGLQCMGCQTSFLGILLIRTGLVRLHEDTLLSRKGHVKSACCNDGTKSEYIIHLMKYVL